MLFWMVVDPSALMAAHASLGGAASAAQVSAVVEARKVTDKAGDRSGRGSRRGKSAPYQPRPADVGPAPLRSQGTRIARNDVARDGGALAAPAPVRGRAQATSAQAVSQAVSDDVSGVPSRTENGALPRPPDGTAGTRPVDDTGTPRPGAVPPDRPSALSDTPLGPAPVEGRRELDMPGAANGHRGSGARDVDIHQEGSAPVTTPPRSPRGRGSDARPDAAPITPPGSSREHKDVGRPAAQRDAGR